ncbi:hypothetical protein Bbelb_215200 [Branchiostoma belcheri]|nr:hypothetical protein Bbelb_215200 [Branchiostoma belcheri]
MFLWRSYGVFWGFGEEIADFLTWWILEKTRKWRPKDDGVVVGRAEFSQDWIGPDHTRRPQKTPEEYQMTLWMILAPRPDCSRRKDQTFVGRSQPECVKEDGEVQAAENTAPRSAYDRPGCHASNFYPGCQKVTTVHKGDDRTTKRRRPFGKATTVRKGDDRSEKRRRPFIKATTVLRKGDDRSEKRRRPFIKATTVLRKGDDRSEKRRRPFIKATTALRKGDVRS